MARNSPIRRAGASPCSITRVAVRPGRRSTPCAPPAPLSPVGRDRSRRRRHGLPECRPGEAWTFFEIDPTIRDRARSALLHLPRRLRAGCADRAGRWAPEARRSRMQPIACWCSTPSASDSIPVHLLTVAALDLYLQKLQPGGVLLLHLSNRNIDLLPAVAKAGGGSRSCGPLADYFPGARAGGQPDSHPRNGRCSRARCRSRRRWRWTRAGSRFRRHPGGGVWSRRLCRYSLGDPLALANSRGGGYSLKFSVGFTPQISVRFSQPSSAL